MKQVVQSFKSGKLAVKEVPVPQLSKGMVLVETKASLISRGTEKTTVNVAKASLLQKARQRPDLVAQVIQNAKKEGIKATFEKVKTKLDSPKALGYSIAGIVKASLDTNNMFHPGDRVACAGQDLASHAEVVAIPQNLVVRMDNDVSFETASFSTLGAIALQGLRQAGAQLGENICVIGLGLLGQLTGQLAKASGCSVFGIDLNEDLVKTAIENGFDRAYLRSSENLEENGLSFTDGHGFDKVIITASGSSNDPVKLASELARKKGLIVIVGAVGMQLDRDPHFYKKELELKMSCSYGPGRYDASYETLGYDYPYAYVRWTEQRNMQAFLKIVASGQINLKPLISHVFDIDNAEDAYKLITGEESFSLGIILTYPERELKFKQIQQANAKPSNVDDLGVSFIGAGSFAQSYLLPNLKDRVVLKNVMTKSGINAEHITEKFGFVQAVAEIEQILDDDETNLVFIASQHNTHAEYVIKCLEAGKHVFVEKPLAINTEELLDVQRALDGTEGLLMIGFNRRFSSSALEVKKHFSDLTSPLLMNFRINAGSLVHDHWTQLDMVGGGRIIGEVCHFIDLMQFFAESEIDKVYAECLPGLSEIKNNKDNVSITIHFKNGSVGTILYASNGDTEMPKERMEIFGGNKSAVIDNFSSVTCYANNKSVKKKSSGKGHKEEINAFLKTLKEGGSPPIPYQSIIATTNATVKCLDSLSTGLPQWL